MTKGTIETGPEDDLFKRDRRLAKAADRGEQLPDKRRTLVYKRLGVAKERFIVPDTTEKHNDEISELFCK
jgi:hypothetical protein